MERTDAAYLAGIIDGEGTVSLVRTTAGGLDCYSPRLTVANTSLLLLGHCLKITEAGSIVGRRARENRRTGYVWLCNAMDVERVLTEVLPYLVLKREQAELLLEFRSLWKKTTRVRSRDLLPEERARQREIYDRIKELNVRGVDKSVDEGQPERVSDIPYRPHTRTQVETEARILTLLQENKLTVQQIADQTDVSRTVVRRIALANEIDTPYRTGDRHWMRRKKASGEGARTQVCPLCQKSFETVHPIQKFCSLACQRKDETSRRSERRQAARKKQS